MNLGKCVVGGRQNDMLSLSEIWEMKKNYAEKEDYLQQRKKLGQELMNNSMKTPRDI